MSQTISQSQSESELRDRNTAGCGVLSSIAQFQEIGCEIDVSIKGELMVRISRDGITYSVREYGSAVRPTRYSVGVELGGEMDRQSRPAAYESVEDALNTLYKCVINDPRQDGIELKGIAHTDTR